MHRRGWGVHHGPARRAGPAGSTPSRPRKCSKWRPWVPRCNWIRSVEFAGKYRVRCACCRPSRKGRGTLITYEEDEMEPPRSFRESRSVATDGQESRYAACPDRPGIAARFWATSVKAHNNRRRHDGAECRRRRPDRLYVHRQQGRLKKGAGGPEAGNQGYQGARGRAATRSSRYRWWASACVRTPASPAPCSRPWRERGINIEMISTSRSRFQW